MNTYGWQLLGQTLLALLALGLAGGWALWPFRRADRPYLWAAAPLAGLLTLGGTLAVLYFFALLPFRWCLWLGLGLNALATVAVLARGRPGLPPVCARALGVTVALGAAYWGTVACNRTAIDARQPTVAALDGSDMFGYAITADWLRAHTWAEPPRADRPFEVMLYVNMTVDGGRPLAFLIAAAAGEARGTTSLFSYDWASGVILAAALLGFGGVFASSPLTFALLVLGAGTSNWLANARSGFFGRSLAYPGTILVAGLFLIATERFTRARVAVLAALGSAAAFALAPVFAAVALGLVAGSYLGALAVVYLLNRVAPPGDGTAPGSFRARVLGPGAAAVLAFAAVAVPAFAAHYLPRNEIKVPGAPANWPVVIPVALDLEPPAMPLLKPATERKLVYGCAAVLLLSAALALRHRQPVALALVGCALVVPASWALGQNLLHTFQGVVYPLTLAGAAALAAPRAAAWWGAARVALVAVLVTGAVALRVPQVRATASRYVYSKESPRTVVRQSDTDAIRALIGPDAVDVTVGHYADNHVALAELVAQGVEVRLRPPAWDRSVRNWARRAGCPDPDLFAPKARYSLVERNAWAPPGTERFVGQRLKLVEDRDALAVLAVTGTQEMTWDREWRPGVWVGNTPTTFYIHNGTGTARAVVLKADTSAGPAHPDRDRRTLRYALGAQTGTLALPKESAAAIPLRLEPGLNAVELSVVERADPEPKPKQPVPLLEFRNWRIDPQ
ncbi:MAG: hypothetical protein FJ304_25000 [Planctomycetes bacterium]|nr:hypothetical protein [Planctomycetota bacterium]